MCVGGGEGGPGEVEQVTRGGLHFGKHTRGGSVGVGVGGGGGGKLGQQGDLLYGKHARGGSMCMTGGHGLCGWWS